MTDPRPIKIDESHVDVEVEYWGCAPELKAGLKSMSDDHSYIFQAVES